MTREKCQEVYDKIADAFTNQSGGDYNDTMYYPMAWCIRRDARGGS